MTRLETVPGKQTETFLRAEVREFDAVDAKGRKIGARASFYRIESIAYTAEEVAERSAGRFGYSGSLAYADRVGKTLFVFRPHALRDGKPYGASHGATAFFATLEEAEAAAEKYFASAAKRAAK